MKLPDKALSIRQPWVWAILNAGKNIENRPRRFNYRGPICLHASLHKPTRAEFDACFEIAAQTPNPVDPNSAMRMVLAPQVRGIVGTADIVDCVEASDSPWFFGPYGLVLENIKPVTFIPVKGQLGLFNWKNNIKGEQK